MTSVRTFGVGNVCSVLQKIELTLRGSGRFFVVAAVQVANFVCSGAFRWRASNGADHAAEVPLRNVFAESRARRFRNVLFHKRAAKIVGAGLEAGQRSLEAELHPGNLNILDRAVQ